MFSLCDECAGLDLCDTGADTHSISSLQALVTMYVLTHVIQHLQDFANFTRAKCRKDSRGETYTGRVAFKKDALI